MNVLDVCVRATMLLGFAGLGATALRRSSAAARHLLWASTLAGLLVLPALYVIGPSLPVAVPAPPALVSADRAEPMGPVREVASAPMHAPPPPRSVTLALVLGVIWAFGAAAIVLRLAVGLGRVRGFVGRTTEVLDPEWVALVGHVSQRLGVRRRVGLRVGAAGAVPVTCGMLRPTVIVPADAVTWDQERRMLVLTHEMAHVRRCDVATHVVGQLAVAIFWFHPLAWLAAARMRFECERACDDLVLAAGARPSRYAGDLLALVDTLRGPSGPAVAALAMGRRPEIEARLVAILDAAVRRGPIGAGRMVVALGIAAAAVGTMAAVRPVVAHRLATITLQAVRVVGAPVDDQGGDARATAHRVRPEIVLANAATDALLLGSDVAKRQALLEIARRYCGHDTLRRAFFAAANTIGSDVERRRVLVGLLQAHSAHDAATVAAIVSSARAMTSDADRAIVLRAVAHAGRNES